MSSKLLYITCYRDMAFDSNARQLHMPQTPPLLEMTIEITPKSLMSEPFPQYTHFICIKASQDCAIAFGEMPVADEDFHPVDKGERLWYGTKAGDRIAVIEVIK